MEEHKEKSGTECREDVINLIRRVAQMTEVVGATFREASEALAHLIIENPDESKADRKSVV